jgi:hypothetical protein
MIGWASILADFAGALLIIVLITGLQLVDTSATANSRTGLPEDNSWSAALCFPAARY